MATTHSPSFATRRFLGHEPPEGRVDYWSEVFADLHRQARDWIVERLAADGADPGWHTVEGVDALPPAGCCALVTHATHTVDGDALLLALRALEERAVQGIFLVLDHQPAALRALAGEDSEGPGLDIVRLLRRIHVETDFVLRQKGSFPARLCRTEVLQLARRSDLGRGGATAEFFHGCRDLYQVIGP